MFFVNWKKNSFGKGLLCLSSSIIFRKCCIKFQCSFQGKQINYFHSAVTKIAAKKLFSELELICLHN